MLLQFSVANFRSFHDRRTLNLVASNDQTHSDNTFAVPEQSKLRLLKCAGVYGPNASGKSNLIKALAFMRRFVIESATKYQSGDAIPVAAFKLSEDTAPKPSEFEIVFISEGNRYVYGFTADSERVHREWLTVARTAKPSLLFQRMLTDAGETDYRFGGSWKGGSEHLKRQTRGNALFLSVAVQYNNPTAQPVFDWFRSQLRGISDQPSEEKAYTIQEIEKESTSKNVVLAAMQIADLGIDDLRVESVPLADSPLWAKLGDEERKKLLSQIPPDREVHLRRVKTGHRMIDHPEALVWLDLDTEESGGTDRFFSLLGPWLYMLKQGCTLFIDEFGTRLHPLLTRMLVGMCQDTRIKSRKHQLIFTTHDSSLLNAELFRRDQIWFTEKDPNQATDLYSLWDYRVRKDENFESGYLKGRYGAVPFIGEFTFE